MGWRDRNWAEHDERDDDETALDDPDAPDASDVGDDDDDNTVPCPHCRKPVYDGAEICPHCRSYLSDEDAPPRRSPLIWAGAILALIGMLWCVVWGLIRWAS